MPTATLIKPKRLNFKRRIWEQGVPQTLSTSEAKSLLDDPRFDVEGIEGQPTKAGERPQRPANQRVVMGQISDAIGQLPLSEADAWAHDGLPNTYALSFIVGYGVTRNDVLAATGAPKDTTQSDAVPVSGSKPGPKKSAPQGRKAQPRIRRAQATSDPVDTGADLADGSATDSPDAEGSEDDGSGGNPGDGQNGEDNTESESSGSDDDTANAVTV